MELDGELRHLRASDAALAMVGLPAEALARAHARRGRPAGRGGRAARAALREARRDRRGAPARAGDAHRRRPALAPPAAGAADRRRRTGASRVAVLATDITARKHAELRLSAGNAAFRALVEDSPDPIALIDADLRIVFVNAALERATGREPAALIGRGVAELGLPPEAWPRGWSGPCARSSRTGERLAHRLPLRRRPRARAGSAPACCPSPGARPRPRDRLVHRRHRPREPRGRAGGPAPRGDGGRARGRPGGDRPGGRPRRRRSCSTPTGSAVYRFESDDEATCVAAHPPAAPGAAVPDVGGPDRRHRDRPHRPHRARPSGLTTTGSRPRGRLGLPRCWTPACAAASRPRCGRAAACGARSTAGSARAVRVRRGRRAPPGRPSRSSPTIAVAERRDPRRARPAGRRPTPSPGSPTGAPSPTRLDGEVERARRHGHMLALAIIDLDDFKTINDTLGHQAGDAVLAEVGRRLPATCRAGELVARIGGEEFAWILPQVDTAGAITAVERARAAHRRDLGGGRRRGITCSAGVCDLSVGERRRRAAAPGRPGALPRQARRARPGAVGLAADRRGAGSVVRPRRARVTSPRWPPTPAGAPARPRARRGAAAPPRRAPRGRGARPTHGRPWPRRLLIGGGALVFGVPERLRAARRRGPRWRPPGRPQDAHLGRGGDRRPALPHLLRPAEPDGHARRSTTTAADVLDQAYVGDGELTYRPARPRGGHPHASRSRSTSRSCPWPVRARLDVHGRPDAADDPRSPAPTRPAVRGAPVTLSGSVNEPSTVTVDDAPVDVASDGTFSVTFPSPPAGARVGARGRPGGQLARHPHEHPGGRARRRSCPPAPST